MLKKLIDSQEAGKGTKCIGFPESNGTVSESKFLQST